MSDAIGSVVDLVLSAVIWRVVGEFVRDLPPALQALAGAAAVLGLVMVRALLRGRRRAVSRR